MQDILGTLSNFVWSNALVAVCLGAGLIFSIMTRFVQVRLFREMIRLLFSSKESDVGISSFQALAVSLSGRVGTGNIAGVAAAIGFGGPGAVFWMWVIALLGSATAYVESTLGQIYKEIDEGQYRGGPAYYIEKALGQKWYAWIFAITTIVACGFLLPGVQSNAIANATELAFGGNEIVDTFAGPMPIAKLITGLAVTAILGVIIFGGVKRIAHVTQVIVPFMALAYIVLAVGIIVLNIGELPRVIGLIVSDAFTPMAGVGAAIGWGVKRGIYSNEAGRFRYQRSKCSRRHDYLEPGVYAARTAKRCRRSRQGVCCCCAVLLCVHHDACVLLHCRNECGLHSAIVSIPWRTIHPKACADGHRLLRHRADGGRCMGDG